MQILAHMEGRGVYIDKRLMVVSRGLFLEVIVLLFGALQVALAAPNIFVADGDNHRIARMNDMTGAGWVSIGSRGAGNNQFDWPWGIFVR